jgi:hypothetical protein
VVSYIPAPESSVQVNDADLDWLVYHLILQGSGRTAGELSQAVPCPEAEIEASLSRLASYLLIEAGETGYRPLAFQEMLVKCHCRHDRDLPFTIEGGIIRSKKKVGP